MHRLQRKAELNEELLEKVSQEQFFLSSKHLPKTIEWKFNCVAQCLNSLYTITKLTPSGALLTLQGLQQDHSNFAGFSNGRARTPRK